jgi:hypothetical protein
VEVRAGIERGLVNSNKWTDLDARYAYKSANIWDELSHLFPAEGNESLVPVGEHVYRISRRYSASQELHHISGGILGTPRRDITTNMIHLSRVTHEFCERYTEGFILCAAVKLQKGEWDSAGMAKIMRVDSVRGWADGLHFQFQWVWEKYGEIRHEI